ncbi:MAG: endonuclease III, partial [Deltaproteobacteria bacterium]|nr:endonuclease III [Deltaproteobacteria bacterium]
MTREERAKGILRILNRLYPHPQVPLNYSTSFSLLVAVLLSAQCTDKRVNSVMPNLLAVADSAAKMAIVPPKIIEEIIRPCGLSKRK